MTILFGLSSLVGGCSSSQTAPAAYDVQVATVKICSFLPTVQTIAPLTGPYGPAVTGAAQIAGAICAALDKSPSSRTVGTEPITVAVGTVQVTGTIVSIASR